MVHIGQRIDLSGLPFQIYTMFNVPNGEKRKISVLMYLDDRSVPGAMDEIIKAAERVKRAYELRGGESYHEPS